MSKSSKVSKYLIFSIAAIALDLTYCSESNAACTNCATGSETYPASWANHRSAQITDQAINSISGVTEYGNDWSNSNVSGTWRPNLFNRTSGLYSPVINSAFNSVRLANLCNSAFLASSDVSLGIKDSRGVYIRPSLLSVSIPTYKDNTGTDITHANLRFHVFGNSINDGSPIHDVDMTGVTLLGKNTFFGSFWNHVNLSVDPVTGRGISFVQHTDGSLIVATVPFDKQPIITDAWRYTWDTTSIKPIGKQVLVKVAGSVGYIWVKSILTASDNAVNPAFSASIVVSY